jgi:2-keto-4-pentenoate hydratase/2-oxohepta-3-ene-1,7-dioic acid hydratase in catechol pathway
MYLVRYEKDLAVHYGHLEGETIGSLSGDIYGEFIRGGPVAHLGEVNLLPPCQPGKIIAVVHNFADRLREEGLPQPTLPSLRFKAPSALIGAGETVRLPATAQNVQPGAELGVVIGRRGRWIGTDEAERYILGYTCANDLIARDVAELDGDWTRAASFDTFLPLGPAIATHIDPVELVISGSVNGVTRQLASTHDMLYGVPQVVAFVSAAMTLDPGDLILMGAPAGGQTLAAGDVVEVSIESVGVLRNPVTAEP